jgi:hypothetical protein
MTVEGSVGTKEVEGARENGKGSRWGVIRDSGSAQALVTSTFALRSVLVWTPCHWSFIASRQTRRLWNNWEIRRQQLII